MFPMATIPALREFSAVDRDEKTRAIKTARTYLIRMEDLIEATVNEEPRRFEPSQARALRESFAGFAHAIDEVVDLLAQERDEWASLNASLAHARHQVESLTKLRDEAQQRTTQYYNEKMAAQQELHQLRLAMEVKDAADCE